MKKSVLLTTSIFGLCALSACGGGGGGSSNPPPPPAIHFSVTAPASAALGATFNFTVTALDASNNPDTTYAGTVLFTSTDPQAVLPPSSTLTNGTGSFPATLESSGNQTITAADTVNASLTATSSAISVTPSNTLTITSANPPDGTVGVDYGSTTTQSLDCVWNPVLGWHLACHPCDPTVSGSCPTVPCSKVPVGSPEHCLGTKQTFNGFTFTAAGGSSPYVWSAAGMPPQLEVDSGTGEITGTPSTAGPYSITVTVTDSAASPAQASANYTIQIVAAAAASADATRDPNATHEFHHYKLIDLGSTFGGPSSFLNPASGNEIAGFASVLNRRGRVAGFADTSVPDPFPDVCFTDCNVAHAFEADADGALHDLGALPGGGSSASTWISADGLIAGVSENGDLDPLYPGLPQLRAVLWQRDAITDLGTLPDGGFQSAARSVNDFGQVVGAALNTVSDANSMQAGTAWLWSGISPAYSYQTRAFLWDRRNGMQDLGTLAGGSDAQAILINDRGQVLGWSYVGNKPTAACTFPITTGSFLWDRVHGMIDLGSFGGTCTIASDLNNRGQVVGASNLAGDASSAAFLWERGALHQLPGFAGGDFTGATTINDLGQTAGFAFLSGNGAFHAVLWKNRHSIADLGTLGADQCSYATSINELSQIVGSSLDNCDSETAISHAFLWESGSIADLNSLIPAGSNLALQAAITINNRGEIAGAGADASGNVHAFLLIPCDRNHPNVEGCDYNFADPSTLPEVRPSKIGEASAAKPATVNPMARFGPLMPRHNSRSRRSR
jgi:uncharacterized membrane protein